MSITSFREMMEGRGCRIVLGLIMAVFILGMVVPSIFAGAGQGRNPVAVPTEVGPVAAEVDGGKLGILELDRFVSQSSARIAEQRGQSMPNEPIAPISPMEESVSVYPGAVEQMVQRVLLLKVAADAGVDLTDKSPAIAKSIDEQLDGFKAQLIATKKLTAGATPEEVDKVFKAESGRTLTQIREENIKSVADRLNSPTEGGEIKGTLANLGLIEKFKTEVRPSEADLNRMYTTTVMKRILLTRDKNPTVDVTKRAEEIRAEIVGKKLTFEDAMDRYSNELAQPNKKVRDLRFELTGITAVSDPDYAELPNLKAGEVSKVVNLAEGAALFLYIQSKPEFPADFKTNKANYEKQFIETMAVRKLQDSLKSAKKSAKITWKSTGVEVLYDWAQFEQDPETRRLTEDARDKKYRDFIKRAEAALDTDQDGKRYAAYGLLGLVQRLEFGKKPEVVAALQSAKLKALEGVLGFTEGVELRMELARIYGKQKNAEKTAENLAQAAQAMTGRFGVMDQFTYSSLAAMVSQFEKEKLLTADMVKQIREPLNEWRKGKVENDKLKAEVKKQEDDMRKKMEAEAKKAAEDAKKNAPKPATPGPSPKAGN